MSQQAIFLFRIVGLNEHLYWICEHYMVFPALLFDISFRVFRNPPRTTTLVNAEMFPIAQIKMTARARSPRPRHPQRAPKRLVTSPTKQARQTRQHRIGSSLASTAPTSPLMRLRKVQKRVGDAGKETEHRCRRNPRLHLTKKMKGA